ncbi:Phage holin, partial [Dysosmobacter welbionis]
MTGRNCRISCNKKFPRTEVRGNFQPRVQSPFWRVIRHPTQSSGRRRSPCRWSPQTERQRWWRSSLSRRQSRWRS